MSALYRAVKEAVPVRMAAERYGVRVNAAGMALCPFHNDRRPSLKVDERFHCFACGADGDVFDFTARLFGLSRFEAAEKLAKDFCLAVPERPPALRRPEKQARLVPVRRMTFTADEAAFWRLLLRVRKAMQRVKKERAPQTPDEEPDSLWAEALKELPAFEELMDSYLAATLKKRVGMINGYGKKVLELEQLFSR